MVGPTVEVEEDGTFVLRNLPPVSVEALLSVPSVLSEEGVDITERLFPTSYPSDPDKEAEWERLARPDLKALFASQSEIIRDDLHNLTAEPDWAGFRLPLPARHRAAWMAGLNAARLTLGAKHSITEADMESEPDLNEPEEKDIALLQIHVLGYVLGLIVEADDG
ncbi:MAG: hypothetical protein CMJ85_03965 [Planctomycetes bacterium]|nr:hypothetical protein [Planctomycetota bacterium]